MSFFARLRDSLYDVLSQNRGRIPIKGDYVPSHIRVVVRADDLRDLIESYDKMESYHRRQHTLMQNHNGDHVISITGFYLKGNDAVLNILLMQLALAGYVVSHELQDGNTVSVAIRDKSKPEGQYNPFNNPVTGYKTHEEYYRDMHMQHPVVQPVQDPVKSRAAAKAMPAYISPSIFEDILTKPFKKS